MKTIIKIFKFLFISVFIYLFISLTLSVSFNKELPMPTFYKDWTYNYVNSKMKNDPFIQLGNYTDTLGRKLIIVTHQKDSLQHIVDSLLKKQ